MLNSHNQSERGIRYLKFLVSFGCAAFIVFLSSCSADLTVQSESQHAKDSVFAPQYSLIFVLHGDGDYSFHDTTGKEYQADEEALARAIRVAQQNPSAEVFIFHQKPLRHFLFFFPLRDGEFYYYRNGRLIVHEMYWRDQKLSKLEPEVELYRRYHGINMHKMVRMFIYCGHEIPEFGGADYDESYPDRKFTVSDLASGLHGFTTDSSKFDLIILSTCFGGTPYTIGTLGSFSRTIIASPENLHLSYLDINSLQRLDLSLQDGDVHAFAKRFAQKSFDRLTRNIQTTVSVVVYNVNRTEKYVNSVIGIYNNTLSNLEEQIHTSSVSIEHCDCADIHEFLLPGMSIGLDVFYRAAHFDRSKYKQNHSGWECRKK